MSGSTVRPPTVVLVHGSMHGAWCWDRVVRRLRAEGVAALAVDLPGHGSREAEWPTATMATYVSSVCRVVDEIAGPIVLVGHSLAGQVAAGVATTRAERIAQLILLNAQVLRDGETSLGTLDPVRQEQYLRLSEVGHGRYRLDDDEIHQRWLQDLPRDSRYVRSALAAVTPQPLQPLLDRAVNQDFGAAGVPAVYLRSRDDVGHPPERADRFLRLLPPRTPVISLPGSHDCMISRPNEVATLLVRHTESVLVA